MKIITVGCAHGLSDAMQEYAHKRRMPAALTDDAVFRLNADGNTVSFDSDAINAAEFMEYLRDYSAEKVAYIFANNTMQAVWLRSRYLRAGVLDGLQLAEKTHNIRTEGGVFEPLSRINRISARA